MYLKKLELFGFKSFADRTELVFHPGFTGVVGPNGCGKSNVVDAFKWIFGEQSAKGLRGAEMKDVIFNGTQHRKPSGFAEVTVIFENEDRFLDIDFAEVAITRRLFRSGESEYLINKEKCRLKDIRELFMGTGIGRTSYSILEQGKIDVLLHANQQERRIIFEEAAGISKYRSKKAETLRSLARVEDNLARLNDVIDEVGKRVARLKSQASKARRYRRHMERLKELRFRLAIDEYRESVTQHTDISFRLYWYNFEMERCERVLKRIAQTLDRRSMDRREREERLRAHQEKLAEERVLLERTRQRIEHGERRTQELNEEAERKSVELRQTEDTLKELTAELEKARAHVTEVNAEVVTAREDVERCAGEREAAQRQHDILRGNVSQKKDELVSRMQVGARLSNKIVQISSEIKSCEGRCARLEQTIAELSAQLLEESKAREIDEREHAALTEKMERLSRDQAAAEEALNEMASRERELSEELRQKQAEQHQKHSRHEVLASLEENLEGVTNGVRDILQSVELPEAVGDIHGMVAGLLKVDSQYARAVEAVLGRQAESLVVETEDGALGLLDLARQKNVGAVQVVCLDRVSVALPDHFTGHAGVLGRLREFISVPDAFAELFDRLLAHVLLVDDFSTAVSLSRNGLRPFRLVTIKGEVIEPWGALSVAGDTEVGLISRRSELEQLTKEISALEEAQGSLQEALVEIEARITGQRACLDKIRGEREQLSSARIQYQEKIAQRQREEERIGRERGVSAAEMAELREEREKLAAEKDRVAQELRQVEEEKTRCEEEVRGLEKEVEASGAHCLEADEALTQSRQRVADSEKRAAELGESVRQQERLLQQKSEQMAAATEEKRELLRRAAEVAEQIVEANAECRRSEEREASLESLVGAEESTCRELLEEEDKFREKLEALRGLHGQLRQERESAQLRDQEERYRRNRVLERIDEEYGFDLTTLFDWEELVSEETAETAETAETGATAATAEAFQGEAGTADDRDVGAAAGASEGAPTRGSATVAAVEERELPEGAPQEAKYLWPTQGWDRKAARDESREVQEKIRRLGNVNLEALEELEELEERHKFQLSQRDDLLESERKLRAIIGEINRTSREMFLQTFSEVQEHFSDLFRKCFGGGKAELVLEEGVDVLEAGIEIVARPPGKRLSSISLLSGGEKTMTTLALLFAILRSRPCPFCLLDEVDAPLDEANIGRFIVLLQEFLKDTQFIVVTHSKLTMAEASTLYGVTMQQKGVSTRVAVELESYDPEKMEAEALKT